MMPERYDIKHYRGDEFSEQFAFKLDLDRTPEDLTGQTIIAQIRESTDLDAALIATFTIQRFDSEGRIILSLSPADTQSLDAGKYVYDVQIGARTRIYGSFVLTGDTSR